VSLPSNPMAGVAPNTPRCHPWLTASSELSSWSQSKSLPHPSYPSGHQLMMHLNPSLHAVPPPVPSPQATASAWRQYNAYSSACDCFSPWSTCFSPILKAIKVMRRMIVPSAPQAFHLHWQGNLFPCLRQTPSPGQQQASPEIWVPFPSHMGFHPAQGDLQEVCSLKKKHEGASLHLEGQSKGWRICFWAEDEAKSGSKLLHGLELSQEQVGVLRTPKVMPVIQCGAINDVTGLSREECGYFTAQKKGWTKQAEQEVRGRERKAWGWSQGFRSLIGAGWEINSGD